MDLLKNYVAVFVLRALFISHRKKNERKYENENLIITGNDLNI